MKTLANCNSIDFGRQTLVITDKIKHFADGIKRAQEAANNGESDLFNIISYICGDNINETMELCGALCFMSGEEFANLTPDENGDNDGIAAIAEIAGSKRCEAFFTLLVRLGMRTRKQSSAVTSKSSRYSE